jgi:uncharacterized integral membrane protein
MWRLIRASFSIVVMMIGIILGVIFIEHNRTEVNVQFPLVARESGPITLGIALIVAAAVGMGFALVIAFIASVGMSLYAARLKREIKSMRKEVDSLRNLPLLEEEIESETDEEDGEDILSTSRTLDTGTASRWGARTPDVIPDGPVHAGSTAAPIGGDDEDDYDEDRDSADDIDAENAKTVPSIPLPGTPGRKLDVT